MAKKFDVISIGSATQDIFILNKDLKYPVKAVNPFDKKVIGDKISVKDMYFDIGGGGSNTAATFSNMGLEVGLFTRVGKDLAGKKIIEEMKKIMVNTSLIEIDKKLETAYSVIFLNKDGDRTALIFRGAADFKKIKKMPVKKLKSDWFFVTTLNGNHNLLKDLLAFADNKNIKIAWNPGSAELDFSKSQITRLLKRVNVLFLNLNEAQKLAQCKTKNIKSIYHHLEKIAPDIIICVTAGKKGAWVKKDQEFYWAGILSKKVVNATGAGDAFGAGFVAGLILYEEDLKKALRLGMLNSNSVVTKMGAKHGLLKKPPTVKMLEKIRVRIIK